ncbi:hypothetical protein BTJ39_09735 [Izhakiella australiensis]|uniref:Uncharacterized protein n=1 Tax=Izhakiella australiensis TaxID=1926881 RepID=A0A1S8YMY9_9GAMM|nr:hypothetical protein BTJ39_09735 [Izhakiella australiensis]
MALLVSGSLAGCQGMFRSHPVKKTIEAPPAKVATMPSSPGADNLRPLAPHSSEPATSETTTDSQSKSSETLNLERCKAQLEALKTLAPNQYPRLNNAFRFIMNGAAKYASIRSETSAETQDTIDALYHYRSNLICAQIGQTMMNTLSLHGAMP